ncbi:MAG TPA: hypothetical protein VMF91_12965 [Bryobacteraceae bacterium]|nr:hypothetical protein [Bryobacteraceae bacterium]
MEAYFTMESISRKSDVTFHALRTRLVAVVNARLQNGEFTERGLAKILGVSQPQIHNVLKGARKLQWDLADRLIIDLRIKLLDLWDDDELVVDERTQRLSLQTSAPHTQIPRKQPGHEFRITCAEQTDGVAAG